MHHFFPAGIREGMTFMNKHNGKTDDNISLLCIDINTLYRWTLSEKLPYGEFSWEDNYEEIVEEYRTK